MLEPLRDTFLAIKHPCMLMLFKNQKCADFDPVFDICSLIRQKKGKRHMYMHEFEIFLLD